MPLTKVDASNIIDGVLPVANGGTGASTQAGAANAILPTQSGQSGKYLTTNGTNTSWGTIPAATPGGSNTQVQYNNAGAFGGDSGFVYSSGNVGIGTSSPTVRLQVSGEAIFGGAGTYQTVYANNNSTTGGGAFTVQQNGTSRGGVAVSGGWLGDTSSDLAIPAISPNIRFYTNNSSTERMRIDSAGNVLLGRTSSDGYKFALLGNTQLTSSMQLTYSGVAASTIGVTSGGALAFGLNNSDGATERMRIDSSGNVGIGTNNPATRLEVIGALRVNEDGAGTKVVQIRSNFASLGPAIQVTTNDPLLFLTNNTEQMRVTAAGLLQFNSGYGSVATAYGCRAWVNFTGSNGAVNGSGNVSSVTRNGTGYYTVNFSSAMPDTNYSMAGAGKIDSNNNDNNSAMVGFRRISGGIATGSAQVAVTSYTNSALDCERVTLIFAR